jgi:cell shape-determining protein MreC
MNYHQRSKKKKYFFIAFGISAILLLSIFKIPLPSFIQDTLRVQAPPLQKSRMFFIGLGNALPFVSKDSGSLMRENRLLKAQVELYDVLAIENIFLKNENARLLRVVEASRTTERFVAQVLTGPPSNPYDILSVQSGTKTPLLNTLVFSDDNRVVLGTITRLLQKTIEVTLFSKPGVVTKVRIGNETIPADAIGIGGGILRTYINHATPAEVGTYVTLDGVTTPYLFGKIVSRENNLGNDEDVVYIALLVNIYTLSDVLFSNEKIFQIPQSVQDSEEIVL